MHRLKQPSTWAGITALMTLVGFFLTGTPIDPTAISTVIGAIGLVLADA